MSSFIGFYGKNEALKSDIQNLVTSPDFSFESSLLFICSTGNSLNTRFQANSELGTGWITCGIGISSEDSPKVLDTEEWNSINEKEIDVHTNLNGHFALARWNKNQLELYTDQLGMRSIFIYQGKSFALFSTRLDWMLSLVKNVHIQPERLGSFWLGTSPIGSSTFLNKIERLGQGGKAIINQSLCVINNKRWEPISDPQNKPNSIEALKSVSIAAHNTFSKTSLGLSGGLDSRVLFALLLGKKTDDWDLYTFDSNNHPDTEIALKLNEPFGKKHQVIPLSNPDPNELIIQLSEMSVRSLLTTSLAELPVLKGYQKLGNEGAITIDGAFGEIGRRRYLRGLELKAPASVRDKSLERLLPFFTAPKANIFNEEFELLMHKGFLSDLEIELDAMPSASNIGVGNWLDLFSIRVRAQNLYGLKQEISDSALFHYMPFLQPGFLNALFSTPEKIKVNAGLFRSIIDLNAPELSSVNLVKGDDMYPYWMKDLSAMAWMKGKRKFGLGYKSTKNIELLVSLEKYIKDVFSSQEVRETAFYDLAKINMLINGFYNEKNYGLASQLGWLLSFEVFRKQIH